MSLGTGAHKSVLIYCVAPSLNDPAGVSVPLWGWTLYPVALVVHVWVNTLESSVYLEALASDTQQLGMGETLTSLGQTLPNCFSFTLTLFIGVVKYDKWHSSKHFHQLHHRWPIRPPQSDTQEIDVNNQRGSTRVWIWTWHVFLLSQIWRGLYGIRLAKYFYWLDQIQLCFSFWKFTWNKVFQVIKTAIWLVNLSASAKAQSLFLSSCQPTGL